METDYDTGQLRYIKSPFLTALAHFSVTLLNIHTPPWTKLYRRAPKTAIVLHVSGLRMHQTDNLTFNHSSPYRDTLERTFFFLTIYCKISCCYCCCCCCCSKKRQLRGDRFGLDACHWFPGCCRIRQGAAHIRERGYNGIKRVKRQEKERKKKKLRFLVSTRRHAEVQLLTVLDGAHLPGTVGERWAQSAAAFCQRDAHGCRAVPAGRGRRFPRVLRLCLEGAEQSAETGDHQVPDPEQVASEAGAQHQPGGGQSAAAQGASAPAAPGPSRLPGRRVVPGWVYGGGWVPRHHGVRDHHGLWAWVIVYNPTISSPNASCA